MRIVPLILFTRKGNPIFTQYAIFSHAHIQELDRAGMRLIEAQDLDGWAAYLKRTMNTICGRYPISVLMHVC